MFNLNVIIMKKVIFSTWFLIGVSAIVGIINQVSYLKEGNPIGGALLALFIGLFVGLAYQIIKMVISRDANDFKSIEVLYAVLTSCAASVLTHILL